MKGFRKLIFKCRLWFRWAKKFFGQDVWTLDENDLSKAKARLVNDVRVVTVAFQTFAEQNRLGRSVFRLLP